MSEPILISGAGIVSAIGVGKEPTLKSLLSQSSGIGVVKYLQTVHDEFPVGEVKLSDGEMMSILGLPQDSTQIRTSLMGMIALKEALQEAGINSDLIGSTGFISGTTVGGMDKSEQYYLDFLDNDRHNEYIATHDCGACTEMIADHFGRFAWLSTISTACSSAANAIVAAANLIKTGEADIVVAGGCECLSKFHLNGFNSLMILDTAPCRPFDATRRGLNLGEGAAYMVLESAASVKRRGIVPLASLWGYGNACDAFHQTASSPDGTGAYKAMAKALEMGRVEPGGIDYINAHGTGTENNDLSESQAIIRLFGDCVPPISSTKSFTGHTTSASGAIEAVICILALQHQFLPVNLNWKEPMENGIKPVTDMKSPRPINMVLCNSFGFGGNDTSLLLSRV